MPELAKDLGEMTSRKVEKVELSGIREFDQQISSIPGLIKLTLGEPDFDVPGHVKEAAIAGINANDSHYAPANGKPELLSLIAKRIKDSRGVDYDPANEIVVTNGGTEALYAIMQGCLNPGDEVLIPTPVFSLYFSVVEMADAKSIQVSTRDDDYVLTPERMEEAIADHPKAKMVLINYPTNPTGRVYSKAALEKLAAVIKKHHLLVVADEIYSDLEYDQEHSSIASMLPEQTILVSGLSKSYAMTGWRVGFLAGPHDVVKMISKVHNFLVVSINDVAQDAAIEAYKNGQDDPVKFRHAYEKRRDFVLDKLRGMGFKMAKPEGAFYVFMEAPAKYGNDDMQFALDLAKIAKVGVIPGSAFGAGGEGHVRISYAASDENLAKAMDQIKAHLSELQ